MAKGEREMQGLLSAGLSSGSAFIVAWDPLNVGWYAEFEQGKRRVAAF